MIKDDIEKTVGSGRIVSRAELFPYLTLRTRSKAALFFEAKTRQDLINIKKASLRYAIPLLLLGGGSNLVVTKSLITGMIVVKNSYMSKKTVYEDDVRADIMISSGYPMPRLVNETVERGLGGLEYHKGLPGTIGGAVCMNSKWTRPESYVGDLVTAAYILDGSGKEKKVGRDYFEFGYDFSIIQITHDVILDVVFRFAKQSPKVLRKRTNEAFEYRKKTQPFGKNSSGCFFKNIGEEQKQALRLPTLSAGFLIDQAGMKGYRIGGYSVSDKHANFILNDGDGNEKDLSRLIRDVKNAVKKKYGIVLQEEVVII